MTACVVCSHPTHHHHQRSRRKVSRPSSSPERSPESGRVCPPPGRRKTTSSFKSEHRERPEALDGAAPRRPATVKSSCVSLHGRDAHKSRRRSPPRASSKCGFNFAIRRAPLRSCKLRCVRRRHSLGLVAIHPRRACRRARRQSARRPCTCMRTHAGSRSGWLGTAHLAIISPEHGGSPQPTASPAGFS